MASLGDEAPAFVEASTEKIPIGRLAAEQRYEVDPVEDLVGPGAGDREKRRVGVPEMAVGSS